MKYRFSVWRLLGTLGVVSTLSCSAIMGGNELAFVHLPSLLVVIVIPGFLMMGVYGIHFFRFVFHGLCVLLFTPQEPDPLLARIALFGSRCIAGSALIFMLIGIIQYMRNFTSPEDIGAGMGVALLAPLYGLIISEFYLAFVHQSFSDKKETAGKVLPLAHAGVPAAVVFFALIVFLLVLLSYPPEHWA